MLGSMTVGVDRRRRAGRLGPALVVALVVVGGAAGCGTASDPSPPSGVDQLAIPTPSPDPDDFVATVDNPWLPLEPGRTWVYEVEPAWGEQDESRLEVSVEAGPQIAGVATTALVRESDAETVVDWYAQDRAGNVWWFGREGEWQAGEDAEAGLAMPAVPRVGDGFRTAYADGVVEQVATVLADDGSVTVPAGTFADVLILEVDGAPLLGTHEQSYARGVGLVADETTSGVAPALRLLDAETADG